MTNDTRVLCAFAALLVAFAGAPVLSKDAEAPAENKLEEITVTAQFREQNLQQTPVAITAVTAAMLEARSQNTVVAITNQAPNVVLKPAAGPYGPSLQAFIRGVGQYDFNFALEQGVGTYVDDVYYSTVTGSIFDLLDLDRVEILRGPQGTLAGQNSIGGAIKLYSKQPDADNGGYAQVTYGSFHRTELRAGGDFTLVDDKLFARIAGVSNHVDGYVTRYDYGCSHPGSGVASTTTGDDCKLGTEGGKAYDAVRASLLWKASDRLEVNLIGDYTNDDSEASPLTLINVGHANIVRGGVLVAPAGPGITDQRTSPPTSSFNGLTTNNTATGIPMGAANGSAFISYTPFSTYAALDTFSHSPYVNYSNYTNSSPLSGRPPGSPDGTQANNPYSIPAVNRVSAYGGSATVDYHFTDDVSLKSITAYRYYSGDWSVDEDATPIATGTLHNEVWHRQFSEELRLNAKLFDVLYVTLGGLYFDQKSHYGGRVDLEPSRLDFLESDSIPGNTKAGFLNLGWQVTDALQLTSGVRYTEQEKTFEYGRLGVPNNLQWGGLAPPAIRGLDGLSADFAGSQWDYRVALQYQWTPGFMTYAQVSTGFKGGGVNPRPFSAAQAKPFGSETLTAYEIGAKTDLLDDRLRINGAVFLNKYEDIQLTVNNCPPELQPPAVPCAAPLNAGAADVKGAELETQFSIYRGLSLDASASYLDFEYTSLSGNAVASGITLDMKTPFAPQWKYSAGLQYDIALTSGAEIAPRIDWSYQAAFFAGAINTRFNDVPGYHLLNARLTWRSANKQWDVALEGTNLTDKLYWLGFFDNQGSTQNTLAQPAQPRQWAISVKRAF